VCVVSPKSLDDPLPGSCLARDEVEKKAFKKMGLQWPSGLPETKPDEPVPWFKSR